MLFRSGEPYSLLTYAETVREFVDVLDCGPVLLGGLSLGGGITLQMALTHPEKLVGIIPLDAWGLFEHLPWHRLINWYVHTKLNKHIFSWSARYPWIIRQMLATNLIGDRRAVTPALLDEVLASMRVPGGGEPFRSFLMHEIRKDGLTTRVFDRLHELSLPTLLVQGSRDTAIPLRGVQEAQQRIPGARLHVMQGCRHWPQKERPEEFAAVTANFAAEVFCFSSAQHLERQ